MAVAGPTPEQVRAAIAAAKSWAAALAGTAAAARKAALAASTAAGRAAEGAEAALTDAQSAARVADNAAATVTNLVSAAYRQGPLVDIGRVLTSDSPEDLLQSLNLIDRMADYNNVRLDRATLAHQNAANAATRAKALAEAAGASAVAAAAQQAKADQAVRIANEAVAGLGKALGAALLAAHGLTAEIPVSGTLLARASVLKDIRPFDPTAGPNANDRMAEWLASDRTVLPHTPRAYAVTALAAHGWGLEQWACLDRLWWHESGWSTMSVDHAQGPTFDPSKTWGIPQAYPASKMASVADGGGPDWIINPTTQINWGLTYIERSETYRTPCGAWNVWRARATGGHSGWY